MICFRRADPAIQHSFSLLAFSFLACLVFFCLILFCFIVFNCELHKRSVVYTFTIFLRFKISLTNWIKLLFLSTFYHVSNFYISIIVNYIGADLSIKSLQGNDALHMAIKMKDHNLLFMLLHFGAGKKTFRSFVLYLFAFVLSFWNWYIFILLDLVV